MRVGIGYDIHALVKNRKLILGGVIIPYPKGLKGHSDGDVLSHAITDALLGAMGEGDIGQWFPDTDKRYKNVDSALFIEKARTLLKKNGFKINNIDATIIAEKPKLSGYKIKIKQAISKSLGISTSQVEVKAKTNEGFGPIGQGKAIACMAIASLSKAVAK